MKNKAVKITCNWCKQIKYVDIVRGSDVLPGKYCSFDCYTDAFNDRYRK